MFNIKTLKSSAVAEPYSNDSLYIQSIECFSDISGAHLFQILINTI